MARICDLNGGELLRLDAAVGARVQVLFGSVWLTEPCRHDDVFAASGDEIVLARGGRVLIESRDYARVIVSAARRQSRPAALIAALCLALRRARRAPAFAGA